MTTTPEEVTSALNVERATARLSRSISALVAIILLISVAIVALARVECSVKASGQVRPAEQRIGYAPSTGIVRRVYFASGDEVQAGTVVVDLESSELERGISLESEQLRLSTAARAKLLAEVQQRVRAIQKSVRRAEDQVRLSKQQVKAALLESGLPATTQHVEVDLWRREHLILSQALARQTEAEAALAGVETELAIAQQEQETLTESVGPERLATLRKAHLLQQASSLRLRAPIHGVVVGVEPHRLIGRFVERGAALFAVQDRRSSHVVLELKPDLEREVELGQVVTIRPTGERRFSATPVRGTVTEIRPSVSIEALLSPTPHLSDANQLHVVVAISDSTTIGHLPMPGGEVTGIILCGHESARAWFAKRVQEVASARR